MSLSSLLQAFYVLSSAIILCASSVTYVRERLVTYGSRNVDVQTNVQTKADVNSHTARGAERPHRLDAFLDMLSSIQVPHWWFMHFYIVSISCSIFWAVQFCARGRILRSVISWEPGFNKSSMTFGQIVLLWTLMLVQGSRRLYESVVFMKPSTSQMWLAHWAIGIAFYSAMSMSIWVEGIPVLQRNNASLRDLTFALPGIGTFLCIILFSVASGLQYSYHAHLATLKKYSLPRHPMFRLVICPHYFAECLLYLSMAILGAPNGSLCNTTMLTALLFVAVNLGVTAHSTKIWYGTKFGASAVKDQWIMIPLLY